MERESFGDIEPPATEEVIEIGADGVVGEPVVEPVEQPQDPTPIIEQQEAYVAETALFGVPVRVHVMASGLKLIEPDTLSALLQVVLVQEWGADFEADIAAFGRWLATLPQRPSQGD